MWPGRSALQLRCFVQDCLGSRPRLERCLRFSGHGWRSKNEVVSDFVLWEPKHGKRNVGGQARTFCWSARGGTPVSPETACRQRWITGMTGEREPCGVDWGRPSSSSMIILLLSSGLTLGDAQYDADLLLVCLLGWGSIWETALLYFKWLKKLTNGFNMW